MTGLSEPPFNDFVPRLCREWDVKQGVAVDVTDLAISQAMLSPSKPVRMTSDAVPCGHHVIDAFTRSAHGHENTLPAIKTRHQNTAPSSTPHPLEGQRQRLSQ
jgi:hypothetical protein